MTAQHTAPAKANLEYKATPLSFSGVLALACWTTASTFVEPVEVAGADIMRCMCEGGRCEVRDLSEWRWENGLKWPSSMDGGDGV